jgi:hypothetical protein
VSETSLLGLRLRIDRRRGEDLNEIQVGSVLQEISNWRSAAECARSPLLETNQVCLSGMWTLAVGDGSERFSRAE